MRHLAAKSCPDGYGMRWVDLHTGDLKEARHLQPAHLHDGFNDAVDAMSHSARVGVLHLREKIVGAAPTLLENTHPFTFGNWSWTHNGSLEHFSEHRAELLAEISPELHQRFVGTTDSEHAFYLFLTKLQSVSTNWNEASASESAKAIELTLETLARITGHHDFPSAMNFIAFSKSVVLATRYNRQLVAAEISGDGKAVPLRGLQAGDRTLGGVMVASEPYQRSLGWTEVPERAILALDVEPGSPLLLKVLADEQLFPLRMNPEAEARRGLEAWE